VHLPAASRLQVTPSVGSGKGHLISAPALGWGFDAMRWMLLMLAAVFVASCSEDNCPMVCDHRDDNDSYDPPVCTYIDEPLLISASELASPVGVAGCEFTFDLSHIPIVQDHSFNDLEISYMAPSTCAEDVWLLNGLTWRWEQVDRYSGPWCGAAVGEHYKLVSDGVSEPRQYVDLASELKMLGPSIWDPKVRVLRIHPDYYRLELPRDASGIAFGHGVLWVATRYNAGGTWHNSIYGLSVEGQILSEFAAPSKYAFDLEFDGEYLWLADGSDSVYQITTTGDVVCRFGVATDYPGGLAKVGGVLWLSEYERPNRVPGKIYRIDLATSCQSRNGAILDSLDIPGKWSRSLAWTGASLLVASDSLYELSTDGAIQRAYPLPVSGVHSVAWDGSGVWMLCSGPKGVNGGTKVIARFGLR